jgi:hypothetical protein
MRLRQGFDRIGRHDLTVERFEQRAHRFAQVGFVVGHEDAPLRDGDGPSARIGGTRLRGGGIASKAIDPPAPLRRPRPRGAL